VSLSLSGKTVLVTGAAGGIGRVLAASFHEHGARTVGVDLNEPGLDRLAADLPGVVTVAADISTAAGADRAVATADQVDVLCNNAGMVDRLALIDEVTEEEWQRLLGVNLTAPFLLTKRTVPGMIERGGGVIINVASVAGIRGGRAGAAYTASKFGLVGLTLNVAATMADRGIRSNALCPGTVDTGILNSVELTDAGRHLLTRDRDKPAPATPDQIASVAVFLASDEASRLNGAVIPVDGGFTAY
jgi:NAD(P)-dependent dehydrogenase (short-subunit alcohol dehydrogenase family)